MTNDEGRIKPSSFAIYTAYVVEGLVKQRLPKFFLVSAPVGGWCGKEMFLERRRPSKAPA
jgi:hypothetical protein